MPKIVTFNGIELSLSKYNGASVSLFDYLDKVTSSLEKGLDKNDENFKMSINVDFEADKPPRHRIYANEPVLEKTKNRVAKILGKISTKDEHVMTGSVKVNIQVEDKYLAE